MDTLEDESKGELHFPLRRFRSRGETEVIRAKCAPTGVADAPAGSGNRGVIEDVEEFRAEFRVEPFFDLRLLDHREVEVPPGGTGVVKNSAASYHCCYAIRHLRCVRNRLRCWSQPM